ncbi:winged helix-turn-helix domain-containing protein [Micromonospora sp. NPDC047707]|uniref:GntR family transcriptional regulator n=1 Tax=unclassified Micromonospora TaxID=2617518 RepID=UPI0012B4CED4|nr:winged helix-turn-helix domain-containing protein [Micromonospora sp. WMMC415]QGN50128.1 GntR family transcriptional regulator [Micromonospora sp. WMMC415]
MIDHEGPVPVYRQLAEILREQILRGDLPPNRPIPSIVRLQQEYGLARGTVIKAVQVLVDEGRVYGVPGRGMYVRAGAAEPE